MTMNGSDEARDMLAVELWEDWEAAAYDATGDFGRTVWMVSVRERL